MPRQTPYSVGRRWKFKEQRWWGSFPAPHYFVVTGPAHHNGPTHKRCRIEVEGHPEEHVPGRCGHTCLHGADGDYSHKHLKKYATLVEEG